MEETIKFILSDIGINLDVNDIEDSHRAGKPDWKTKSKNTIKRLVNRRYRKKKLIKKYNFRNTRKIFIDDDDDDDDDYDDDDQLFLWYGQRNLSSLISSEDYCQRFLPSRISNMPQAGFEPPQTWFQTLLHDVVP